MKFIRGAALIVVAMAAGASYGQQKPGTQGTPSQPDFYDSGKTLSQLLSDGWEFKSGDMPGFGTIHMFLVKGRDLAICVSSGTDPKTGKKANDSNLYSSCGWTIRP